MNNRSSFLSLARIRGVAHCILEAAFAWRRTRFSREVAGRRSPDAAGKKWPPGLLIATICVAVLASPVRATTVEPPAFATLVTQAEIIFSGEVVSVLSKWAGQGDERHIESQVSFKVLKVLKGNPPAIYVMSMVGGTVGDQTLEIVGAPKFKVGDKSVLFVENNGTQIVPLVGMMHGHYGIKKDAATGEEVLHKHDGTPLTGTQEIDQIHAKGPLGDHGVASPAGKPMRRADFENAIEQHLRSAKP